MNSEYNGTYLKYRATSTGAFSFDEHEWVMVFKCNNVKATFTKKNVESGVWQLSCDKQGCGMKRVSDGSWIFLIDSSVFGPGWLSSALYADIPDEDFDPDANFPTLKGVRREIKGFTLEKMMTI